VTRSMEQPSSLMWRRDFLGFSVRGIVFAPALLRVQAAGGKRDGVADWDKAIGAFEKQLPLLMQAHNVPGASLAMFRDTKVAWRRGFGVKDASSGAAVDVDTIFEAASMSKPVFAYAVRKLCEKGVMNLDTPLTKYTPKRFLEGDPRLDLITARHVLCHTSGFQNWRSKKEPLAIHFTPGEKWQYSGEGYSYLQSVVELLTGEPIQVYMKKHVFEPFGMTSSGYVWDEVFEKRMARPHDEHGKTMNNKKSTAADVARYGSSGALLTTPSDYAKFYLEVIDPKPADDFRLTKASLAEVLRPQVKVAETPEYSMWWGLGWRLVHTKDGDSFGHGGDNEGFHCESAASLEKKSGFVIMTNGENGAKFLHELLTGGLLKPLV
jgi:CubicO group peptidase (beta-lactamase class C family)